MKDRMRIFTSLIGLLTTLVGVSAQTAQPVPRLVVTVFIDQLRSDYIEAFSPLYSQGGFDRLMKEGRVYGSVNYPLARIDRAAAISTLFTGTVPFNHGIVGEQWLDRATLRPVYCVDDYEHGFTPSNLAVTTLTDELKLATSGRSLVYSFAPDREMAILSAGHAADGAFWVNEVNGEWTSASFYGSTPGWFEYAAQTDPLSHRLGKLVYEPYSQEVAQFNYFLSNGLTTPFKHKFSYKDQYSSYKASPFINDEMNLMVKSCLDNTTVGQDEITDFISVSYYAGNFEHRSVLERPLEMQDMYVRLDRSLKDLLDMLDDKVGLDKTLVVLTSSGAEEKVDVDMSAYKIPQGTFYMNRTSALLNMYFMATYGQGRYVDATFQNQIYLNYKQFDEKQIDLNTAFEKARDFLLQCSGVKNVYTSRQLLSGTSNTVLNLLRNNYNAKCSGDISVELLPGWNMINEEMQMFYRDYTTLADFPLYFLGYQVVNEQVYTPVSIDVVAPTLASFMRIRAPNACTSAPLKGIRR